MSMEQKSNFAVTCNLLSQYLKEKKGGLAELGGLGIMAARPAADNTKGKSETPRTMNLLPGVDTSAGEQKAPYQAVADLYHSQETKSAYPRPSGGGVSQMTIFYDGEVIVIDKFPEEKAMGLMAIAGKATHMVAVSASTVNNQKPQPDLPTSSDLPIARRASLSRFLEKRKDRVISKSPYQVIGSSSSFAAPQAELAPTLHPWLGLAPTINPAVQQQ